MIELNATLFIQMIHFLVAWWILDRFLFQYVVAIIQKKRRQQKKEQAALETLQEAVEQTHHKQELLLKRYKKQFKEESPVIQAEPTLSYSAVLCPHSQKISSKSHEKLLEETEQLLVEKVSKI